MKVALAQSNVIWEDKAYNLNECEKYVSLAKQHKVDLILFPEMSFTGFSLNVSYTGELIINKSSETINYVRKLAIRYQICIGFGMVETTGQIFHFSGRAKNFNKYLIVDCDGKIKFDYDKVHPFTNQGENKIIAPGDHLSFVKITDCMLSGFVCYDLRFPELFQAVAKYCQFIFVAANWPEVRQEQFNILLRARAIETQCYVAGVNRVGDGNGIVYSGGSVVYNPLGQIASTFHPIFSRQDGMNGIEGISIGNIDVEDVANYKESFPVLKDKVDVRKLKVRY